MGNLNSYCWSLSTILKDLIQMAVSNWKIYVLWECSSLVSLRAQNMILDSSSKIFLIPNLCLNKYLLLIPNQMHLRVTSWNICGMGKFYRWPDTAQWFLGNDIIMIRQSLQTTNRYPLIDVICYDVHAISTAGRARGGLVIALQNR